MTTRTPLEFADITNISDAEWQVRKDVALCYRLIAHYRFSDLTDGFVSARIPETDDLIVGGYGRLPELVRASSLYRRPIAGKVLLEKKAGVDVDARHFSRTLFEARPDATCCIHAHPFHSVVFSALDCEMEPISQYAFMFRNLIGYVPFATGDVTSDSMCGAIGRELARGCQVVVLRNHGLLIPGRTVADAFWILYRIEQTFRIQIEAMKTGARFVRPSDDLVPALQKSYAEEIYIDNDGLREWDELKMLIDRTDPAWKE